MRALALVVAIGCGSSSQPACTTDFTGNITETVDSATCATIGAGSGGDQALAITVTAPASGTMLTVSIDLGTAPSVTTYSSETVMTWSALGSRLAASDPGCYYTAGNSAVPTGSFIAHARCDRRRAAWRSPARVQYVQASPGTDRGAGDNETVAITF